MKNNKTRSNSKNKSTISDNSQKKKKLSSGKEHKFKLIPKNEKDTEKNRRELISPKTIDYSKSE